GAVRFGGNFRNESVITFVEVSFRTYPALLAEVHLGQTSLVYINFDLQIFWVSYGEQSGAGTTPSAKTLRHDQFVRVDELFEDYAINGRTNDSPIEIGFRQLKRSAGLLHIGLGRFDLETSIVLRLLRFDIFASELSGPFEIQFGAVQVRPGTGQSA